MCSRSSCGRPTRTFVRETKPWSSRPKTSYAELRAKLHPNSPGQIRTAVAGSKDPNAWPLHHGAASVDLHGRIKSIGQQVSGEIRRSHSVDFHPEKFADGRGFPQDDLAVFRRPREDGARLARLRDQDRGLASDEPFVHLARNFEPDSR